jgi:uncharacterized protein (DUF4415 family)
MSKTSTAKCINIRLPSEAEDRRITEAANSDPDALPLTDEQLDAMLPAQSILKAQHKKVLISMHYSPEVVDYFKATGQGWQTRMDEVLREYVNLHK